ncbi:MAG: crosslink repair DNA glycosylase YcaQ family protein [Acuticoccus sp.]
MTPVAISNRTARAIFMERHGLAGQHDWQAPGSGLLPLVDHLGFVQVDSINTVERAHHMILSARSRRYRPQHLKRLLERDRTLFEHWTHDAALIPTRFFPHWQLRFARDREKLSKRWRNWRGSAFEAKLDEVRDHIREHGAVTTRTVGEGEERKSGGWWEWHPSKTALEFLWRTGELAVCRREGFIKVFDLTERVVPAEVRATVPSPADTIDWACNSALDRLGFATSGELAAFWDAVTPQEAKDWCARRLGTDLVTVTVETGEGPRLLFARPDLVDTLADVPEPPDRLRILSPFDPLLRDRRRAERLFDFFYRIEVFVPAPKRRYGYYVFPVMEKDRMIGRIDMKRMHDGTLCVSAFWPEPWVTLGKGRLSRLEAELSRVARFCGCACVTFQDGWQREPL